MTFRTWFHSLPNAKDTNFLEKTGYKEVISLIPNAKFYDGKSLLPNDDEFVKFIRECGDGLSDSFYVIPVLRDGYEVMGVILKGENKQTYKYIRKGYGYIYIERDVSKHSRVIVVEGLKDAFIPSILGFNVLVCMGTAIPKTFIENLNGRRVVLFFDNDDAGDKAYWSNIKLLKRSKVIRGILPKKFNDLGDCFISEDNFREIVYILRNQLN